MLSVQKNTQKEQEEKVNKENSAFDEYDSEELDQPKSKRTKTESDTEQVSSFSVCALLGFDIIHAIGFGEKKGECTIV